MSYFLAQVHVHAGGASVPGNIHKVEGILAIAVFVVLTGCGTEPLGPAIPEAGAVGDGDLTQDLAIPLGRDMEPRCDVLNACGDCNPGCRHVSLGPPTSPFPLKGEAFPDSQIQSEYDSKLVRDGSGYLRILPGADLSPNPDYRIVIRGCGPEVGPFQPTEWRSFAWRTSEIVGKAGIRVQVLSGNTDLPDGTWVDSPFLYTSPYDLSVFHGHYLAVDFQFGTSDLKQSALLQHFEVTFECPP